MHLRHGAPVELWQALVSEAAERAGCAHDESRESYLVFMLLRHQKDGQLLTRTQALDWLRAHAQAGRLRDESLREVGDRCLLIAGLYPALAERRRVDVGYFMDLGRSAYLGIADAGGLERADLRVGLPRPGVPSLAYALAVAHHDPAGPAGDLGDRLGSEGFQ